MEQGQHVRWSPEEQVPVQEELQASEQEEVWSSRPSEDLGHEVSETSSKLLVH